MRHGFFVIFATVAAALAGCKQPVERTFAFTTGAPSRAGLLQTPKGAVAANDFGAVTLLEPSGHVVWRSSPCHEIAVRPALSGAVLAVACANGDGVGLSLDDGKELWRSPHAGAAATDLAADDSRIFGVDADATAWAAESATGAMVWRRPAELKPSKEKRTFAPPVAWGDVLVTGLAEAGVHALDAAQGALRWKISEPNPVGFLTLDDGVAVLWQSGRIALVRKDGKVAWSRELGAHGASGPALAQGLLWVGTQESTLRGVDPATGADRAHFELPAVALARVVSVGPLLVALTSARQGHLIAFHLGSPTPVLESRLDCAVRRDPLVEDDALVVAPTDGRVLGVRPATAP